MVNNMEILVTCFKVFPKENPLARDGFWVNLFHYNPVCYLHFYVKACWQNLLLKSTIPPEFNLFLYEQSALTLNILFILCLKLGRVVIRSSFNRRVPLKHSSRLKSYILFRTELLEPYKLAFRNICSFQHQKI